MAFPRQLLSKITNSASPGKKNSSVWYAAISINSNEADSTLQGCLVRRKSCNVQRNFLWGKVYRILVIRYLPLMCSKNNIVTWSRTVNKFVSCLIPHFYAKPSYLGTFIECHNNGKWIDIKCKVLSKRVSFFVYSPNIYIILTHFLSLPCLGILTWWEELI